MADDAPNSPPPAGRRGLRIALFLSLALNLLILGAVAGAVLSRGPMAGRAVLFELGLGAYTMAMDEVGRRALRDAWRNRGPDLRALREARQEEYAAFAAAVRADPIMRERMEETLSARRNRDLEQHWLAHEVLTQYLAALPASDRVAYAERLEALARHGGPRGGPMR